MTSLHLPFHVHYQELHVERAAMARMGFLDKAEELDVMIEAERARLKKVQHKYLPFQSFVVRPRPRLGEAFY